MNPLHILKTDQNNYKCIIRVKEIYYCNASCNLHIKNVHVVSQHKYCKELSLYEILNMQSKKYKEKKT